MITADGPVDIPFKMVYSIDAAPGTGGEVPGTTWTGAPRNAAHHRLLDRRRWPPAPRWSGRATRPRRAPAVTTRRSCHCLDPGRAHRGGPPRSGDWAAFLQRWPADDGTLIPTTPEEITAQWLSTIPGDAGRRGDGQPDRYRADRDDLPRRGDLRRRRWGDLPATFVVKLPPRIPRCGQRLVRVSGRACVSTPRSPTPCRFPCRCYHCDINSTAPRAGGTDMAPAVQGDQIAGCGAPGTSRRRGRWPVCTAPRWCDPGCGGFRRRGDGQADPDSGQRPREIFTMAVGSTRTGARPTAFGRGCGNPGRRRRGHGSPGSAGAGSR